MTGPILRADSIGKSYGHRRVLTAATFEAHPARITLILGRNGSGKSTLLKIASGWIRPDHGLVIFQGIRYVQPRLHELAAAGLFYVAERSFLQENLSLRVHLAALEAAFPDCAGGTDRALAAVNLSDFADAPCRSLSGGERRRADLAVALARRPLCLLADEPFQGVSPMDIELVGRAIRDLAAAGCAVVVTGHETHALLDLADNVVWQTAGTTHYLGSPQDARGHDQFRREYLAVR